MISEFLSKKTKSKNKTKKGNMYEHCIQRINVAVGCKHGCLYCKKSFQAQMRRQMNNCAKCGDFIPHVHEDRIQRIKPKKTTGYEFVWYCASCDIAFIDPSVIEKILVKIQQYPEITFFFQSKDPDVFLGFNWPENVILGTTLETNRNKGYQRISKAPLPITRYMQFLNIPHSRKSVTIEPILDFDLKILLAWLRALKPERVYIGFDTKKNNLPEPSMEQVKALVLGVAAFTHVFCKYMKGVQIHYDQSELSKS